MTTKSKAKARARTLVEAQAFAVGHEVRIEALTIFNERVASPKDIAETLGIGLNKAGHHVKILVDQGCIELVKIEPRGGSAEHFYRGIKRPKLTDKEWDATPEPRRRSIVATIFRNLIAEGLSAIRAGRMSTDPHLWLSWKAMSLDAQGRREVADEQRESAERLEGIEAGSAARMIDSGDTGISTIVALLGFARSRNAAPAADGSLPGEG